MADKNIKKVYKILDAENILKERIKVHNNQVNKTIKYFESLKVLKRVNGNQSIEKVHQDIEKALDYFKKLNSVALKGRSCDVISQNQI